MLHLSARPLAVLGVLLFGLTAHPTTAQDRDHAAIESPFGTYGENGLPFFGQTLDARRLGGRFPADNLTPRGLIVALGHAHYACFDPDLLRLALVWQADEDGSYLRMNGMAPGSYRQPHRKSPAGQGKLPTPLGTAFLANGLYPGIQVGATATFEDPRERSVDRDEPGLGPLPPDRARWLGLRLEGDGPVLLYQLAGIPIEERLAVAEESPGTFVLTRTLLVAPHPQPLVLLSSPRHSHLLPPATGRECWTFRITLGREPKTQPARRVTPLTGTAPSRAWPQSVSLPFAPAAESSEPYVVDEIPLPVPNPWRRNVRPSSFDFFPDGRLALVTFDGDVWIADDIRRTADAVTWRRFAGGLHEPMGLRIENGQVLVFDRNGLVRLHDRDNNGEADHHENVSSIAAQTAETREFAMGFELKPGGGYYLAKGGQVQGTRGKLNGCVVEVSADGNAVKVIASGLRQPFIAIDPKSGTLTASDQQGHWVPATPLHLLKPGHYYGFQPVTLGAEHLDPTRINEPPLWIPHFVNQSGSRQVWVREAKMGALNDALLHLGYNRPAIHRAYLSPDASQGALVPVLEEFPTGLLDGRINPADGRLYVGGLNIWCSVVRDLRGLFRVRPTGKASWLPESVTAFEQGVLLRFSQQLDPALATRLAHYTVDRWNYKRSAAYGSGHYTLDGAPGQEQVPVASVVLSTDRRALFLGLPGMEPCHTLRVTYRVAAPTPTPLIQSAYLTIRELAPADPVKHGFQAPTIDLTMRDRSADGLPDLVPTAAEGRRIATQFGCLGCHSTDGSRAVNPEPSMVVGPSWKGLYGSKRVFVDGTFVKNADDVYLRESILDPSRNVTKGFETSSTGVGMPSYLGVLNDAQVEALILYLKSLQ